MYLTLATVLCTELQLQSAINFDDCLRLSSVFNVYYRLYVMLKHAE